MKYTVTLVSHMRRCSVPLLTPTILKASFSLPRPCWLCVPEKRRAMCPTIAKAHSIWTYLARTKLFEQLAAVDDEHAERALALATSKLGRDHMAASDQSSTLGCRFLHFGSGPDLTGWQADVRELAAASKSVGGSSDRGAVRRIRTMSEGCYMDHLAPLPDSRVIRRLLSVRSEPVPAGRSGRNSRSAFFSLFAEENRYDQMEGYYFVKLSRALST